MKLVLLIALMLCSGLVIKAQDSPPANLSLQYGLIGHWTFNEGSGTNFADASGLAHNAWSTNAILFTNGIIGAGILATNGIFCGSNLQPANITVSAWVKSNGSQPANAFIVGEPWESEQSPRYVTYAIQVGTDPTWTIGTATYHTVTSPNPLITGQWTLLTGTYDGTTQCLYTNGVLAVTNIVTDSGLVYYTDETTIGWESASSYSYTRIFNGVIDDVMIYNRALTATEIKLIYNGGYGIAK